MAKSGVPLLFPNGKIYHIQGLPLGDTEKQYPELAKAMALYGEEHMYEQALAIVRLQNPEVTEDEFRVDLLTYVKMQKIWHGQAEEIEDELKKKT